MWRRLKLALSRWRSENGDDHADTARELLAWELAEEDADESALPSKSHPSRCSRGATAAACCLGMVAAVGFAARVATPGEALPISLGTDTLLLEGSLPNQSDYIIHAGGFCFRGDQFSSTNIVGSVHVEVTGTKPFRLLGQGALYVVMFDDEPAKWDSVQPIWNVSHLQSLIRHSSVCLQLARPVKKVIHIPGSWLVEKPDGSMFVNITIMQKIMELQQEAQQMEADERYRDNGTRSVKMHVSIKEKFKRRWNVAIIAKGFQADGHLRYRLAAEGAIDQWPTGESGPPGGSCPVQPVDFMKEQLSRYVDVPGAPTVTPEPEELPPAVFSPTMIGNVAAVASIQTQMQRTPRCKLLHSLLVPP
eukprot:TRINITY_DN43488_c0_g3_i1.p1 TRINITY_DN43488_c0_g3~~TRINITY_DN43488_c0_g3_i1.p1  ORF type:complete len:362 (+),score=81.74 TRINITY_DN43488_c0_g3_i1:98-1183(+)